MSRENKLAVGLFTSAYHHHHQRAPGGKFLCTIAAIQSTVTDNPESTTTTVKPVNCDCGWKQHVRA